MTRRSRHLRRADKRPGCDYNVSEAEAAEFLGISTKKLASLRRRNLAPFNVRFYGRYWYALADLIAFYKLRADAPPATFPDTGVDDDR